MVEKTYHLAPYLASFGAYLMPQLPYRIQQVFLYPKLIVGRWRSTHNIFNLVRRPFVLVKNPKGNMVEKTYHLETYLGPFELNKCLCDPYRVKTVFPYTKMIV